MERSESLPGKQINYFLVISLLIFITGFFNISYKLKWHNETFDVNVNLWNPTWMLFGPLHYFWYRSLGAKNYRFKLKYLLHLIPFLLFFVFFLVAYLQADAEHPWKTDSFVYYQNSYIVICLSLIPYSLYTFRSIFKNTPEYLKRAEILIITISGIYILIAIITAMLFFAWGIVYINMGVDYRYFSYSLLLFINIAIDCYWVLPKESKSTQGKEKKEEILKLRSYRNSELAPELAKQYMLKISEHFNDPAVYLAPSHSLDILSRDLDIPKHHLSQLFNVHFEKNFHTFLAEYRIAHAIRQLNENQNKLKIESLAYSCGFNSKTSFNRYFKELTGLAPSAYQEKLKKEQKSHRP